MHSQQFIYYCYYDKIDLIYNKNINCSIAFVLYKHTYYIGTIQTSVQRRNMKPLKKKIYRKAI